MGRRQGAYPALHTDHIFIDGGRAAKAQNGLDDSQRISGAMIDLAREKSVATFSVLSIGQIDRYATHSMRLIFAAKRYGGRNQTPARLARWTNDSKLRLKRAFIDSRALKQSQQSISIVCMKQRTDEFGRGRLGRRFHAEYPVLPFVHLPSIVGQTV